MASGSKYSNSDHYLDPDSGILINKLSINDEAELETAEAILVSVRLTELLTSPMTGAFDLPHFQAVHRYLFQDIYTWAGELRNVDISKGSTYFASHNHIVSAGAQIFRDLKAEQFLSGLDKNAFVGRTAYYLGELNALHPFRDGNGRAQREFITQLCSARGYSLYWEEAKQEQVLDASIKSFNGNYTPMETMLHSILRPLPRDEEKSISPYVADGLPATYDDYAGNTRPESDRHSVSNEKDRDDER
jgi:fido (protein-threonine AMPylation protein)